MSLGKVYQFVDFSAGTGGDSGEAFDPASILPLLNGQDLDATNIGRAPENLRQRTEALRASMFDVLYMLDADRNGMCLSGPGLVTWGGSTTAGGTGIFTLSDNLYLMPFLTPGQNQTPPVPPVSSKFGSLTLKKSDAAAGIIVTSTLRSYKYGNLTSVTVVAGTTYGIQVLDSFRTIVITATASTTLSQVISDLNALLVDTPTTSIVSATLAGGALGTDTLLRPQAKQFMDGNIDAEAHTITPAALSSFFATVGNRLAEGDTLAIAYAANTYGPSDPAPLGGRRQSIPENSNTSVPAGSLFNTRVSPGSIVNGLPICKVVGGKLVFVQGTQIPKDAAGIELGGVTGATMVYQGGGAWADGTTNPLTTIEGQLDKIITDLTSSTGLGGAGKIKVPAFAYAWGSRTAEDLQTRIQAIEAAKANLNTANTFTATQAIDIAGDDETAAMIKTTLFPTNFKHVMVLPFGDGSKVRMYADLGTSGISGIAFTTNARWNPGTSKWVADINTNRSSIVSFNGQNWTISLKNVGASPWNINAWDTQPVVLDYTSQLLNLLGSATLTDLLTAARASLTAVGANHALVANASSNPASRAIDAVGNSSIAAGRFRSPSTSDHVIEAQGHVAMTGAVPAKNAAVATTSLTRKGYATAWAVFTTGPSPKYHAGYNILGQNLASTFITIDFAIAMPTKNYAVVCQSGRPYSGGFPHYALEVDYYNGQRDPFFVLLRVVDPLADVGINPAATEVTYSIQIFAASTATGDPNIDA